MMNVVSELSLLTCYKQNWLQWLNCRRLDSHDLQNSPSRKFSIESEHTRNCEVKRNSIFKDTWTIVPFPIAMGLWNITQAKCKKVSSTTGKTISTAAELTELFSEIPLSVSSLFSCCYIKIFWYLIILPQARSGLLSVEISGSSFLCLKSWTVK